MTNGILMRLSDFDYFLPKELIAIYPPRQRTSARLLKVDRQNGDLAHHHFFDLKDFLSAGDVLVLNNTKVIPARIFGQKPTGGRVEALILKKLEQGLCEVLLKPGGRIKKEMILSFGENGDRFQAEVLDDPAPDSGNRKIKFIQPDFEKVLERIGHIPLPPYIDRPDTEIDRELYQTVFAQKEGAVASPTAGLHFDHELLDALKQKGVEIIYVTLHVSHATFRPVTCENLAEHKMYDEEFEVSEEAAQALQKAVAQKRRIIACGTTSARSIESAVDSAGKVTERKGNTNLFIYPPYSFKVISGLITNFHLPKSTLLLLVAAFLGDREKLFRVYEEAIREHYRFYSYGDAMLVL